jgi:hypothetical protein
MWIIDRTKVRGALLGSLVVAATLLLVSCGGSSTTTTSALPATTAPPTTAAPTSTSESSTATSAGATTTAVTFTGEAATIAENWAKFFDGKGPMQEKAGLLENGDQYAKQIEANASSPLAQGSSAQVTKVTITSDTGATVTYTILMNGQPVLPDQTGEAVKQDGVWKVGAQSFLALLALQGGAMPTTTAP